MKRSIPAVSPGTLAKLSRHSWRGNVRELENCLERALIETPAGERLAPVDLTGGLPMANDIATATLDDIVRRAITTALRACNGRIYGPSGAASRLGVKPSTLQSKMKRLGVER